MSEVDDKWFFVRVLIECYGIRWIENVNNVYGKCDWFKESWWKK